jgi:hypothetical protein
LATYIEWKERKKPKQFIEAQVEGRKQRGRQRITFESRIEEIGSRRIKTLAEMKKMARDIKVWRSWRKAPDAVMAQTRTEEKNPLPSAGFEPANLGSSGKHTTTRSPRTTFKPTLNKRKMIVLYSLVRLLFLPYLFCFIGNGGQQIENWYRKYKTS